MNGDSIFKKGGSGQPIVKDATKFLVSTFPPIFSRCSN